MIKRISVMLLSVITVISLFSGCAQVIEPEQVHIVCTAFAQYDWTKNLLVDCDGIRLTLLLDSATDMHSYQATAKDIVTISSADLFIYTGGDSDAWTEDVIENSASGSFTALNLMNALGNDRLYCVEEDEEHSHEHDEEHKHHLYDEHIWMSPEKAVILCEAIKDAIIALDTQYNTTIEKNYEEYREKLLKLHNSYKAVTEKAVNKVLIVADRFPFLYLVKDYGLEYCAAFVGCSAESEAGAGTIIKLIEEIKHTGADSIIITETSNGEMAETIKENTEDCEVNTVVLHSLQSVKDSEAVSYISLMEKNLSTLETVLS